MTILLLDLHAVDFYGFQSELDSDNLASILRGVDAGDSFDPLAVRRVLEREIYFLDATVVNANSGRPEGGHHRAYAHLLRKKPLPVHVRATLACLPEFRGVAIRNLAVKNCGLISTIYSDKRIHDKRYR